MITFSKVSHLRLERSPHPQAPFWQAGTVSPYGSHRAAPISINYLTLQAISRPKLEVTVTRDVVDQLERERRLDEPLLVDATEYAERVFRRGEEAYRFLLRSEYEAMELISTEGRVPDTHGIMGTDLVIAAWPPLLGDLEHLFQTAEKRGFRWGVLVPVLYPVTTAIDLLERLADLAAELGASYFAAVPIDLDPTAKHALAASLEGDAETYETLFHSDLETITVATERHIAALAAERQMQDRVLIPSLDPKSNWNGAILLTITGTRMMRMKREVELGWSLLRSAKAVAALHKPIARIAAAANLSIVESLDPMSVEILEDWLRDGSSQSAEKVNEEWRLRRDYTR